MWAVFRQDRLVDPDLSADLSRYVDPLVGTRNMGHTYPGATVPFGMVQPSPDTRHLKMYDAEDKYVGEAYETVLGSDVVNHGAKAQQNHRQHPECQGVALHRRAVQHKIAVTVDHPCLTKS